MVELSKPQLWFLQGVSSGVGKETTLVLALHGVHIVMGVRNTDSGRKVREVILEENSNAKIDVKELDLNSMASARNFSSAFNSLGLPLNLLIINAGVFASPFMLSQDNKIAVWDKSFRSFSFVKSLLETMKSTTRQSHKEGKIVNVSSVGHWFAFHGIQFDRIQSNSVS